MIDSVNIIQTVTQGKCLEPFISTYAAPRRTNNIILDDTDAVHDQKNS